MSLEDEFDAIKQEYGTLLQESSDICYMSCASELQATCGERILDFRKRAKALKKRLVAAENEELANLLLPLELQLIALFYELGCLIGLKENHAHEAWDHLVRAQEAVATLGRFYESMEAQFNRLRILESLLFPRQTFMSCGMFIEEAFCSICSKEYANCTHVINHVYSGELCNRIITKADLYEVSVLDGQEPRDRRCRVTHLTQDGIKKDLLTGQVELVANQNSTKIAGYAAKYN